jgi:hypothetical protein
MACPFHCAVKVTYVNDILYGSSLKLKFGITLGEAGRDCIIFTDILSNSTVPYCAK